MVYFELLFVLGAAKLISLFYIGARVAKKNNRALTKKSTPWVFLAKTIIKCWFVVRLRVVPLGWAPIGSRRVGCLWPTIR
ncbi:MAG: hypothetical protein F082_4 [bacterium F082]|nr:MAG: hypothetical protein F082_4 [bacterium F082]KWW31755.1 MAG: hypothetical protein AUK64_4 [bacterium P201]